jgi:hypothetical protein
MSSSAKADDPVFIELREIIRCVGEYWMLRLRGA